MKKKLLEKLPALNDSILLDAIEESGELVTLEEGDILIKKGQYPKFIPLILEGVIKVSRIDDEGNEIFLYYLSSGESCSMTLACCTNYKASKLSATVEEKAVLIKIPITKMDEWMSKYSTWRSFVFNSLNNRLNTLLNTVDEIAFNSLDERLIIHINKISEAKHSKTIHSTHQQLASELSTSREVISRLLKKLESKQIVKLGRNKIELL